jgi:hypothetical protein
MNIRKLTPCEFARAIKLGHGRAFLHIVEHGDHGIEQEIENALLTCYVYDWQIEGTRAYWVFNLAEATGRLKHYAARMLERCAESEFSHNDLAQQIQIAWQFFESGYPALRKVAFEKYPKLIEMAPYRAGCGTELVDIAGAFGLEFAARTIGQAATEVDDFDCSSIYDHAEDVLWEGGRGNNLLSLAADNPDISRFLDACARHKEDASSPPSPRRPHPTFEEILEKIERHEHAPSGSWYRYGGRHISEDDARKLYAMLEETCDPWKQLAYLRMFANRTMPEVGDKVFKLLESPDRHTATAAAQALAQLENPLVRDIALTLIGSSEEDKVVIGFDLLENNYQAGDGEVIRKALANLTDEAKLHSVGMSIRTIAERNKNIEMVEFLNWFYENGPDSWCRRYFLEELLERKACPAGILFEAQWDCADLRKSV